jgi:hypothetical protein
VACPLHHERHVLIVFFDDQIFSKDRFPSQTFRQPSIINHQPSTVNHQPSTINHQPSTINSSLGLVEIAKIN